MYVFILPFRNYIISTQSCLSGAFLVEATCKARGDPHYTTFDGRRYDFMGECEYVLAKDSANETFEIRQANEPCGNGVPTCTRSVTVIFGALNIELRRGMTMVNGAEINLPQNGAEVTYGGEKKTWFEMIRVAGTGRGQLSLYLSRGEVGQPSWGKVRIYKNRKAEFEVFPLHVQIISVQDAGAVVLINPAVAL